MSDENPVPETLETIAEKITALSKSIDTRFEAMDTRFEAMDTRFEAMDARFGAMDARFGAMDARFGAMDARFATIDAQFARLDARITKEIGDAKAQLGVKIEAVDENVTRVYDEVIAQRETHASNDIAHTKFEKRLDDHDLRILALERGKTRGSGSGG